MRKKAVDSTYFNKIDSEEKAYFLGYILCDGCVSKNQRGYLRFNFASKDREIVERLRYCIKSEHTISSAPQGSYPFYQIFIADKVFCESLISLGVVIRKTWNQHTCYIPEGHLLAPFIRGLFDGDGTVGTWKVVGAKGTYLRPRVCFNNLNLHLHRVIKDFCESLAGCTTTISRWREQTWRTRVVGGRQGTQSFLKAVYVNSNVHLSRKYQTAMELLEYYTEEERQFQHTGKKKLLEGLLIV